MVCFSHWGSSFLSVRIYLFCLDLVGSSVLLPISRYKFVFANVVSLTSPSLQVNISSKCKGLHLGQLPSSLKGGLMVQAFVALLNRTKNLDVKDFYNTNRHRYHMHLHGIRPLCVVVWPACVLTVVC